MLPNVRYNEGVRNEAMRKKREKKIASFILNGILLKGCSLG
jgi:hypothetical protein